MEHNNTLENIDPDYKIHNTALRKIQENEKDENKQTFERITNIIEEEFEKELTFRQKQLEEIEEKIYKAQRLLHLVRYVLISCYYNKNNLECSSSEQESGMTSNYDVQSRVHPAIKKLLGHSTPLEVLNPRGKRKVSNKNSYGNTFEVSQLHTIKKIRQENVEVCENSCKSEATDSNQGIQKSRKKFKYRIIVGNISKWMPSSENDNTTHKWMVYVRGLKEAVDISQVIEKVVFHLHPSYKPHDVIEISNYPFHLSRRGWGEFPLRVQIFFKCPLNKSVNIIHNLKLDKTYTGRQTLGNETIVDLYLHDSNLQSNKEFIDGLKSKAAIQDEQREDLDCLSFGKSDSLLTSDDHSIPMDLAFTSNEHNYCYEKEDVGNIITNVSIPESSVLLLDHSYSLPYGDYRNLSRENSTRPQIEEICAKIDQPDNNLIYGLGEFYIENNIGKTNVKCEKIETLSAVGIKTLTAATGQSIKFLPQNFNKLLLSNRNFVQIRFVKRQQPLHNTADNVPHLQRDIDTKSKIIDYEKYKIILPKNQFKSLGEVLPYLFKRLPLFSEAATCLEYKRTYPFIATSEVEFLSWNIGKRINSEWCRAKAVKQILSGENFPDIELWNTKTYFMYGRSHAYSSFPPCSILFRKLSDEVRLIQSCFTKFLPQREFALESGTNDIVIDISAADVLSDGDVFLSRKQMFDLSDGTQKGCCAFVKQTAFDCGITLKPEEVCEGVIMNATERMIYEAMRCFAEELIRRSTCHLVCYEHFSEEYSEVTVREIKMALDERTEMKSIIDFQKKKREIEFFS